VCIPWERYNIAAATGCPKSQYAAGRCYRDGFGVVRDGTAARALFVAAAQQGHAKVKRFIASMQIFLRGNEPFLLVYYVGDRSVGYGHQ